MKSYFGLVWTNAFLLTLPTVHLVDKSRDLYKPKVREQLPDHIRCCDEISGSARRISWPLIFPKLRQSTAVCCTDEPEELLDTHDGPETLSVTFPPQFRVQASCRLSTVSWHDLTLCSGDLLWLDGPSLFRSSQCAKKLEGAEPNDDLFGRIMSRCCRFVVCLPSLAL